MPQASGKKLINSPENCVDDSLRGIVAANDQLQLLPQYRVVVRRDYQQVVADGKVAVVSGGGSGHEPLFAGFVGEGFLTAAIAGSVFASPPAKNILAALRLVGKNNKAGTLAVVANYTGDKLNFGLAVERAKVEGSRIEMVLVGEDCALVDGNKSAGRRGLSGVVLVLKIAGALAEEGRPLLEIVNILNDVIPNLGSIGLSLTPCSIPGFGPNFTLKPDEMELGLGVHGESGVARMKLQPAKEAIHTMFSHLTNPKSVSCLPLNSGDKIVLLVNNLGGTSQLEINIVLFEAIRWLEERDIEVARIVSAPLMTSLEMAGITLTLLKATDDTLSYIDKKTPVPGWPQTYQRLINRVSEASQRTSPASMFLNESGLESNNEIDISSSSTVRFTPAEVKLAQRIIKTVCTAIANAKSSLNELDRGCGDGDTGNTLSSGASAILDAMDGDKLDLTTPFGTLQQLSSICQQSMGGVSGALYAIFFAAASSAVLNSSTRLAWVKSLKLGTKSIMKYGGAEPGDRTLLDALHPAISALEEECSGEQQKRLSLISRIAADAAHSGSKSTEGMPAKAGRASYVSSKLWEHADPGATAVAVIFTAIAKACDSNMPDI